MVPAKVHRPGTGRAHPISLREKSHSFGPKLNMLAPVHVRVPERQCYTSILPQLRAPARAALIPFPSAFPSLTGSASAVSQLLTGFRPVCHRLWLSPFRYGLLQCCERLGRRFPALPTRSVRACQVSDSADRTDTRESASVRVAFRLTYNVGRPSTSLFRLNGWPTRSRADAYPFD